MTKRCPPGLWCFNDFFMGLIGVIVAIVIGGLALRGLHSLQQPQQQQQQQQQQPKQSVTVAVANQGESRYNRAPQPLRDWMAPPELPPRGGFATIPINIATQGLPESFQAMGNINTGNGKILPLYGRRTMRGSSDRWNYYTRTDTYNPVPLPLRYKNRDCMDDIGCPEVFSGEVVQIEGTGESGHVRVFRYDGPKYVPGLL
jgi:type II secretory pathway pseudopilin PulG